MLSSWFDHKITVERQTSTKDASGGQVFGTWSAVAGYENIDCAIYDGGQKTTDGAAGARRDWSNEYTIVTDQKLILKPGDRIHNLTDAVYYDLVGDVDHSNAKVGREVVFAMSCRLRRVTAGAQ